MTRACFEIGRSSRNGRIGGLVLFLSSGARLFELIVSTRNEATLETEFATGYSRQGTNERAINPKDQRQRGSLMRSNWRIEALSERAFRLLAKSNNSRAYDRTCILHGALFCERFHRTPVLINLRAKRNLLNLLCAHPCSPGRHCRPMMGHGAA